MERVNLSTRNILDENAAKLAELFPEVVTEVREEDGTLRHAIDVEALKARVGDVAEGQRERYQFTWPGKRDAKQEAYRPIDKCLRPCPEESVDWDTTQNLYIEGDNLDALKLLRDTYAGKVKMIYIDPPYNTGHDFVYNDDFARTAEEEREESGAFDVEGNVLDAAYRQNNESNGRFHSDWCSMMYPRLLLARDLLSEDGVVFVSIDENEDSTLIHIAKEVFGFRNYLGEIIWDKRNPKGSVGGVSFQHELILVFARNRTKFSAGQFIKRKEHSDEIQNKAAQLYAASNGDSDIATKKFKQWLSSRKTDFSGGELAYSTIDEYGRVYQAVSMAAPDKPETRSHRPLIHPLTGKKCPVPAKGWRFTDEKMDELVADHKIAFGKDEATQPRQKYYLTDNTTEAFSSLIYFGGNGDSLGLPFDNPKPLSVIKKLIESRPNASSLVIDFFSGSATTAHAVMQLNAEDGGNRKFIMVQLPEVCDEKSEAAKAGYRNICEIGKERIRRAGRKIVAEVEESNRQLKLGEEPKKIPDIGFRVLKIDSSNFKDVSAEPAAFAQETLMGLADNLKPDRTAEDLLFQVMPQLQIPLSASIEKLDIQGFNVFSVDGGRLVACFDGGVTTDVIAAMAKMQPDYAVMRDASFIGDDAVSNFSELFKTHSPATITKVI
ncbi:MAG TPA: site-specific DNA-methyltransferase [Candidatus Aphodovivens avistercoris]|nr:site-specific DNA-methyltransferase [Candidatus Aphodovivens avistercoris]